MAYATLVRGLTYFKKLVRHCAICEIPSGEGSKTVYIPHGLYTIGSRDMKTRSVLTAVSMQHPNIVPVEFFKDGDKCNTNHTVSSQCANIRGKYVFVR